MLTASSRCLITSSESPSSRSSGITVHKTCSRACSHTSTPTKSQSVCWYWEARTAALVCCYAQLGAGKAAAQQYVRPPPDQWLPLDSRGHLAQTKRGVEIKTNLVPLLTRNHHSNHLYIAANNPLPILFSVLFPFLLFTYSNFQCWTLKHIALLKSWCYYFDVHLIYQ